MFVIGTSIELSTRILRPFEELYYGYRTFLASTRKPFIDMDLAVIILLLLLFQLLSK